MNSLRATTVPDDSLLVKYRASGAYTDCYALDFAGSVSLADYVEAFYTTWVFKLERWILGWLVARPSTNAEAALLAQGELDRFAAWDVEQRSENQILLCDFQERTRSWLMVLPDAADNATRLYFGSAVVPVSAHPADEPRMGLSFSLLLGFHKLYSRVLLGAAGRRLRKIMKR